MKLGDVDILMYVCLIGAQPYLLATPAQLDSPSRGHMACKTLDT